MCFFEIRIVEKYHIIFCFNRKNRELSKMVFEEEKTAGFNLEIKPENLVLNEILKHIYIFSMFLEHVREILIILQ